MLKLPRVIESTLVQHLCETPLVRHVKCTVVVGVESIRMLLGVNGAESGFALIVM